MTIKLPEKVAKLIREVSRQAFLTHCTNPNWNTSEYNLWGIHATLRALGYSDEVIKAAEFDPYAAEGGAEDARE